VSLRAAAPEDYIVINNQGNHKKWSRLCTDRHIVREIRPYIPVIVDGNSIIWAPGIRIGESYKVDSSTKRIICFEYLKQ
jgi:thiamine pyrophosphate-dependent acetolactate synthase large subunit-like protein